MNYTSDGVTMETLAFVTSGALCTDCSPVEFRMSLEGQLQLGIEIERGKTRKSQSVVAGEKGC